MKQQAKDSKSDYSFHLHDQSEKLLVRNAGGQKSLLMQAVNAENSH